MAKVQRHARYRGRLFAKEKNSFVLKQKDWLFHNSYRKLYICRKGFYCVWLKFYQFKKLYIYYTNARLEFGFLC